MSTENWDEMDKLRLDTHKYSRDYYNDHKSMEHGRRLSNGKYEWIDLGAGRKRYWSDDYDDYVDMTPAEQRNDEERSSSSRGRRSRR